MEVNTVISNITFLWHSDGDPVKTFPRTESTPSEWGSPEKKLALFQTRSPISSIWANASLGKSLSCPWVTMPTAFGSFQKKTCNNERLRGPVGGGKQPGSIQGSSLSWVCTVRISLIPSEARRRGFYVLLNSEPNPGASFRPLCYSTRKWHAAPLRGEACK